MNDLITGANGFIGYHLSEFLSRNKNRNLTLVDNFSNSELDAKFESLIRRPNVQFINLDLTDYSQFSKISRNFDTVYHFAAINGTQNFYNVPFLVAESAGITSYNLLKYFSNSKIGKLVFASTSENYASSVELKIANVPTNERVPLSIADITNPRWSYASGKIFSEVLINGWAREFNSNAQILRIHNIYGSRMGYNHVIPDFFQRCIKDDFRLYGANQSRSFLFIDDAIQMIIGIIAQQKEQLEIFNIGSNDEILIKDLAKKIMKVCGRSGEIIELEAPEGSVGRRVPDLSRVMSVLKDFKFTPLKDGLEDFYKKEVLFHE
jgi:UDP-glucose 4-epimerase